LHKRDYSPSQNQTAQADDSILRLIGASSYDLLPGLWKSLLLGFLPASPEFLSILPLLLIPSTGIFQTGIIL